METWTEKQKLPDYKELIDECFYRLLKKYNLKSLRKAALKKKKKSSS